MGRKSDFRSGQDVVKYCKRQGCEVRPGKGDHMKVYPPSGGMIVVPQHRELKTGTRASIMKALAAAGLLVFLLAAVACWMM